jgi:hypothetical protein
MSERSRLSWTAGCLNALVSFAASNPAASWFYLLPATCPMALWRLVVISAAFSGKRGGPSNSCLPNGPRFWAEVSALILYVVISSHGKETAAAGFL